MADVTYAFDQSGVASANLVINETHTTTEANFRDYRFIVPKLAPFFSNNLVVKHQALDGTVTTLEYNKDYSEALPYVAAQRSLGKAVYGAITLSNEVANGLISITYQTIGGEWICDAQYVLEYLAEKAYNPRVTIWDNVTNVQELFPVIDHYEPYDSVYGQEYLVESINQIATAIMGGEVNSDISHSMRKDNPHSVTATQVGLGSVLNAAMATNAQALEGTDANAYINPINLKYVLDYIRNDLEQVSGIINGYVDKLTAHANGQDSHGLLDILSRIASLESNETASDHTLSQSLANLETKVALLEQFKSDISIATSSNTEDISTLKTLVNGLTQQLANALAAMQEMLANNVLVFADSAPSLTGTELFWWDRVEGQLYVKYVDSNNDAIWVQAAATGSSDITLADIITVSDTAPVITEKSVFWYDSGSGELLINYNGVWVSSVTKTPEPDIIAFSDSAPSLDGTEIFWWDSDDSQLFVKYTDSSNTTAWVQAVPEGAGTVLTNNVTTIIDVLSDTVVNYDLINAARTNSSSMDIIFNIRVGYNVTLDDLTNCSGMTLKFRAHHMAGDDVNGIRKLTLNQTTTFNGNTINDLIGDTALRLMAPMGTALRLMAPMGILGDPGEVEINVLTNTSCNIRANSNVGLADL